MNGHFTHVKNGPTCWSDFLDNMLSGLRLLLFTECLIEQITKELKSYCSRFTLNILMASEKSMLFRYDSLYSVLLLQFITFTSLLFSLLGVGSYRIYRILGSLADIKLILHFLYTSWNKHQCVWVYNTYL